jgi:hypothetical protein
VGNIMRKYNSNFSENEETTLLLIIEEATTVLEFKDAGKEKLGVSFLSADIRKMLQSKNALREEKNLELTRLELFQEKNTVDLNDKIQSLIQLSIENSMRQNTTLATHEITEISQQVLLKVFP